MLRKTTLLPSKWIQVRNELHRLHRSLNDNIHLLEQLRREDRSATKEESIILNTPVRITDVREYIHTLILEAKTEKKRSSTSLNTFQYNPFVVSQDHINNFIFLLGQLPPGSSFDFHVILITDDTGHATPLRIHSDGEKTRLFLFDAAGGIVTNVVYADLLAKTLAAKIYKCIQGQRQYTSFGCFTFAVQDLHFMSQTDPDILEESMEIAFQANEEFLLFNPKLIRNSQRVKNIKAYSEANASQSLIVSKKGQTLEEYTNQFVRSVILKEGREPVESNFSIMYKTAKFIQMALNKLNELESSCTREVELEEMLKRRNSFFIQENLRDEVNQHYSRESGYELEEIQALTFQFPHLDLYQMKLAKEFGIPIEMMTDLENVHCFKPNKNASKFVYDLIRHRAKQGMRAEDVFNKIKKFDHNQLMLIIAITKKSRLLGLKKDRHIKKIKDGFCFLGKTMTSVVGTYCYDDDRKRGYYEEDDLTHNGNYTVIDYIDASNQAYILIKAMIKAEKFSKIEDITYSVNISEMRAITKFKLSTEELEELENGLGGSIYHQLIYSFMCKIYDHINLDSSFPVSKRKEAALRLLNEAQSYKNRTEIKTRLVGIYEKLLADHAPQLIGDDDSFSDPIMPSYEENSVELSKHSNSVALPEGSIKKRSNCHLFYPPTADSQSKSIKLEKAPFNERGLNYRNRSMS